MNIEFIKGHGSENDFLLIDEISNHYSFSEDDRRRLSILLCSRNTGIGADGILFVMNSEHANGKMRVFNADGTEASMCGNGLRLVARYICEKFNLSEAIVETMKASLHVKKEDEIYPNVVTYQVEISPVSFSLQDLPMNLEKESLCNEKIKELSGELYFTALAVPNPHLISIVEQEVLESNIQEEISKKVNLPNELFPDGVNVSFVHCSKPGSINVNTYERGVGFTNACGTAMSASSLVSILQNYNEFNSKINVYNNGGMVQCVVRNNDNQYSIDLIGNATYLYKCKIHWDKIGNHFTILDKTILSEEEDYKKFQKNKALKKYT